MSQFGMQMGGMRGKRAASPDVFTAMMGVAVISLAVACFVMWTAGSKIGADGNFWGIQKAGGIAFKDAPAVKK